MDIENAEKVWSGELPGGCISNVISCARTIIAARDQRIAELENQLAELSTENLNNVCERDKAKVKLQMCEKERDEARRDALEMANAVDEIHFRFPSICNHEQHVIDNLNKLWGDSKLVAKKYKDAK